MATRKLQNQDKFIVRLPYGLRDRIRAAAETNKRSMNAEIVRRLEWSLEIADISAEIDHMRAQIPETETMLRKFEMLENSMERLNAVGTEILKLNMEALRQLDHEGKK